jgi:hypothetical protein
LVKKGEMRNMKEELRIQLRQAIGVAVQNLPFCGRYTSKEHRPVFERYVIGQNKLGRHSLYEISDLSTSDVMLDVIQDTDISCPAVKAAKIRNLNVLQVAGFGENLEEEDKTKAAIELLRACNCFDRILIVPQGGVYRIR